MASGESHASASMGDDGGSSGSTSQSETESEGDSSDALGGAVTASCTARPGGDWQRILRSACGSSSFSWPVRLILPCAGWDAPCQALQILGVEHRVVGAWDTDAVCGDVWKAVHHVRPTKPLPPHFHAGRQGGDIQRVKLRALPDADMLVSGPPCPPFSSQGKRRNFADSRAKVFFVVLSWIFHLARRSLKCFVLENVMGMLRKGRTGGQAPVDIVLAKLRRRLPDWHIEMVLMNSTCTGQSRKRVYVVGYVTTRVAWPSPLQQALPRLPVAPLSSIVRTGHPNTPLHVLGDGLRRNLKKHLKLLTPKMNDKRFRGQFAVIEVDRNPERTWGAKARVDGLCHCLRAGHHQLFLISLGEGSNPKICRYLLVEEAAALQGISADIIPPGMSRRVAFRGIGNAMTVPVVGAVMFGVLGRAAGGREVSDDDAQEAAPKHKKRKTASEKGSEESASSDVLSVSDEEGTDGDESLEESVSDEESTDGDESTEE